MKTKIRTSNCSFTIGFIWGDKYEFKQSTDYTFGIVIGCIIIEFSWNKF